MPTFMTRIFIALAFFVCSLSGASLLWRLRGAQHLRGVDLHDTNEAGGRIAQAENLIFSQQLSKLPCTCTLRGLKLKTIQDAPMCSADSRDAKLPIPHQPASNDNSDSLESGRCSPLDISLNEIAKLNLLLVEPWATMLNASYNQIDELEPVFWEDLPFLRALSLAHNDLQILPRDMFAGATSLLALDLSDNGLGDLPTGVFEGMVAEEINLSQNLITWLGDGAFSGLQVTTLNLSRNMISSLNLAAFEDASVDHLDLSGNHYLTVTLADLRSIPGLLSVVMPSGKVVQLS